MDHILHWSPFRSGLMWIRTDFQNRVDDFWERSFVDHDISIESDEIFLLKTLKNRKNYFCIVLDVSWHWIVSHSLWRILDSYSSWYERNRILKRLHKFPSEAKDVQTIMNLLSLCQAFESLSIGWIHWPIWRTTFEKSSFSRLSLVFQRLVNLTVCLEPSSCTASSDSILSVQFICVTMYPMYLILDLLQREWHHLQFFLDARYLPIHLLLIKVHDRDNAAETAEPTVTLYFQHLSESHESERDTLQLTPRCIMDMWVRSNNAWLSCWILRCVGLLIN